MIFARYFGNNSRAALITIRVKAAHNYLLFSLIVLPRNSGGMVIIVVIAKS